MSLFDDVMGEFTEPKPVRNEPEQQQQLTEEYHSVAEQLVSDMEQNVATPVNRQEKSKKESKDKEDGNMMWTKSQLFMSVVFLSVCAFFIALVVTFVAFLFKSANIMDTYDGLMEMFK